MHGAACWSLTTDTGGVFGNGSASPLPSEEPASDASTEGGGGCTPDLLFCDDFDHAVFSEVWTSQNLGVPAFTPDGGLERSPFDGAPSPPNTLLAYNGAGNPGFLEGPRLRKTFPPGDYSTLHVRFDMLIEVWEPLGVTNGCCTLWPFVLSSTFDAGTYVVSVGDNLLSWMLNPPAAPATIKDQAPLFDRLQVGVWTHIDVFISGQGDARTAILRVDGAKQASLKIPADFPRPESPLDFFAGVAELDSPATNRIRLDNVVVDTK
jgi:hypothetical protein